MALGLLAFHKRKYISIYIRKGSHARLAKGYVMFFAFAYKGGSLRASFVGLLEVVETWRGTVLEGAECFGTIPLSSSPGS